MEHLLVTNLKIIPLFSRRWCRKLCWKRHTVPMRCLIWGTTVPEYRMNANILTGILWRILGPGQLPQSTDLFSCWAPMMLITRLGIHKGSRKNISNCWEPCSEEMPSLNSWSISQKIVLNPTSTCACPLQWFLFNAMASKGVLSINNYLELFKK